MIEIKKARIEDVSSITRIARENALINVDSDNLEQGFLVSEFKESDYEQYIQKHEHFYVLTDKGNVSAFLMAHKKEDLDITLIVNRNILRCATGDFHLIKQVCVARDSVRQGLASELYNFFISKVNSDIYLAVVLNPYNEASIKFHNNLGFDQIMKFIVEDGKDRGIFYRPANNIRSLDKDFLIEQYKVAIDLYKHEDELNWSKMNHLFYVTVGMMVVLTFIYDSLENIVLSVGMLLLSFIAIAIAYLFHGSIKSGIKYLQRHKRSVYEIEDLLYIETGRRVVSTKFEKEYNNFQKSYSSRTMFFIPRLLIAVWVIVGIYHLWKIFTAFF